MDSRFTGIDDFLGNKLFREWVSNPTPQSENYWKNFVENHPEQKEAISKAKEYLNDIRISVEADFPEESQISRMYAAIEEQTLSPVTINSKKRKAFLWLAAASVAGWLIWSFWVNNYSENPLKYDNLVKNSDKILKEYVNNSPDILIVNLPDSSRIRLNSGSRLSYSENPGQLREVYLEGSAFFEIARDTTRPFHVYVDELITKVLGTSFHIQSSPDKDEMTVSVVTGKVSVTTREGVPVACEGEMLLTPNQQARFQRKTTSLRKTLVANPVIVKKPVSKDEFEFDDAPAGKIFRTIERSYGVQISFDETKLGSCLLTASLTDETLFEMMDLLCTALNARYSVEGTRIVVTGSCPST